MVIYGHRIVCIIEMRGKKDGGMVVKAPIQGCCYYMNGIFNIHPGGALDPAAALRL